MYAKQPTHRSEAWRRAIASLPCICCKVEGQTQAAHPNHIGKALALKADDCWCVPLCFACHREFDQGTRWKKYEKHDLMNTWIILTIRDLAIAGLVKA